MASKQNADWNTYNHYVSVRDECSECGPFSTCPDCAAAFRVHLQQRMFELTGSYKLDEANRRADILSDHRKAGDGPTEESNAGE